MNIKKYIISSVLIVLISSFAWATPATHVQLKYDLDTHMLHIDADHPTDRLDRYFVQRVVITKNSQETQDFNFPRQTRPDKFIADLDYKASPGDHLDAELFSSDGGVGKGNLDIPMSAPQGGANEKTTVQNGT